MIRVNANLFRIAYAAVDTKEARHYLRGVFVEPNPRGGVNLVSTDGHRMLCIYDKRGSAEQSAIVALDKTALRACKPKITRFARERRYLALDASGAARVEMFAATADKPEGDPSIVWSAPYDARVDGTFPDYRRVLPAGIAHGNSGTFDEHYLSAFADVAADLNAEFNGNAAPSAGLRIVCADPETAALILFGATDDAFGVLMPIRGNGADCLPDWIKPAEKAAA